jgi:hypothetical protein
MRMGGMEGHVVTSDRPPKGGIWPTRGSLRLPCTHCWRRKALGATEEKPHGYREF